MNPDEVKGNLSSSNRSVHFMENIEQLIDRIKIMFPVEFFDRDGYLWDILTALRGPDKWASEKLKELTISRIRGILQIYPGSTGCMVNNIPLTKIQKSERDALLQQADFHFRYHYNSAVQAIRVIYKYDLLNEKEIKE